MIVGVHYVPAYVGTMYAVGDPSPVGYAGPMCHFKSNVYTVFVISISTCSRIFNPQVLLCEPFKPFLK
jgi:hypothetical protein